jgi:hypothetical protein
MGIVYDGSFLSLFYKNISIGEGSLIWKELNAHLKYYLLYV